MMGVGLRRRLRAVGLVGLNERNVRYTLRCNPRRLYPRVDDKLRTKALLGAAGIPTARVVGAARVQAEVPRLVERLREETAFALKPAHGAMGNGILVVRERDGDRYRRSGGQWMAEDRVRFHASSIVSGLYALGGQPDVAFAEECLEVHPALREIASDGVPDLRVVVYRGVPVMAMTRLPTVASRGRANLHQGAVGAGIDLATGRTTTAVFRDKPCVRHPDSDALVVGRPLPHFARALEIAVGATDLTELGYVGADVVIDARHGPVVLELNARPGLAIQVANRAGLRARLDAVDARGDEARTLAERLALGAEIGGSSAARPH